MNGRIGATAEIGSLQASITSDIGSAVHGRNWLIGDVEDMDGPNKFGSARL